MLKNLYKRKRITLESSVIVKMRYVVDMLGFVQPGSVIKDHRSNTREHDYILKELAIASLDVDTEPKVFLFKEPFPLTRLTKNYKDINTNLERNYHGLSWESGHEPYRSIGDIIRESLKNATVVYVAGAMKKKWLERFRYNVKDLAAYAYPPLDNTEIVCENHNEIFKTTCALQNVKLLKKFINQSETLEEVMEWI